MLSFRTLIFTGALALASLLAPTTASAAIVSPWIHVQGVGFTDQNGLPVVLRGVNQQGGTGVGSNGMALTLGSNFVRILAPWSTVEDTAPVGGLHVWNQEYLQRLDDQMSWHEAHDVNVVIDFPPVQVVSLLRKRRDRDSRLVLQRRPSGPLPEDGRRHEGGHGRLVDRRGRP